MTLLLCALCSFALPQIVRAFPLRQTIRPTLQMVLAVLGAVAAAAVFDIHHGERWAVYAGAGVGLAIVIDGGARLLSVLADEVAVRILRNRPRG